MSDRSKSFNLFATKKVGGFYGVNRLCSAEAYNPANDSWNRIASIFSPLSNFGIEVLENLLYVVGGFTGFNWTFKAYYDRKTNKRYSVHNMNINRSGLDCCILPAPPVSPTS